MIASLSPMPDSEDDNFIAAMVIQRHIAATTELNHPFSEL